MGRADVATGAERGRSAVKVAIAVGASAGVSYLVMWLATRALSTSAATTFLTVLSLLFFAYGLLSGLATEVTRSSAAAMRDGRTVGPSLWRVSAVSAAACSSVFVVFVLVWHRRLLGPGASLGDVMLVAMLTGVGVAGYAFHSTVVGALTGRRRWSGCAGVVGAEAFVRLSLTAVAALAGAGMIGMIGGSTASAVAVGGVLLLTPSVRRAMATGTDRPGGVLGWRIAQSMLAQASSAAVVVGFPVMLASTTDPSDYRRAAPLILAISLTRAPLLIPLNAVQGIAVSYLVHAGRRVGRALFLVVTVISSVGVVGSLLAWVVGPWLMTVFFGSDYRVDGTVLALLTLSATLLAVLTITGATCQAAERHAVFVGGWLVATVTTASMLLLPGSLEQRSVVALLAGPVAGLAVHVVWMVRDGAGARRGEMARAGA